MKMRNRIVTVMLAVALVCALLPTVALADTATPSGSHYADVPTDAWYAEAVNAMTEGGLLTGYTDGLFHPDDPITYAQFVTILCRIMGLDTETPYEHPGDSDRYWEQICTNQGAPGRDHWARNAWEKAMIVRPSMETLHPVYDDDVKWLLAGDRKIFTADYLPKVEERAREQKFDKIDDNVCRGKVIGSLAILASGMPIYQTVSSSNSKHNKLEQITPKIWTEDDIPDWNIIHNANGISDYTILLAYNIGITNGVDVNGTCNPEADITRAQLCQLLWNMTITSKNSVGQIESEPIYETNLQFYKTHPTPESAYGPICKDHATPEEGRLAYYPGCCPACELWDIEVNIRTKRYEREKQTAYEEHAQWLEKWKGTRQWEIATMNGTLPAPVYVSEYLSSLPPETEEMKREAEAKDYKLLYKPELRIELTQVEDGRVYKDTIIIGRGYEAIHVPDGFTYVVSVREHIPGSQGTSWKVIFETDDFNACNALIDEYESIDNSDAFDAFVEKYQEH